MTATLYVPITREEAIAAGFAQLTNSFNNDERWMMDGFITDAENNGFEVATVKAEIRDNGRHYGLEIWKRKAKA